MKDADSRVRVSAIRALGNLKDASVAEKIIPNMSLTRAGLSGCGLAIDAINVAKKRSRQAELDKYYACNSFKNEYLEIATTLGRLLPNTNNQQAIDFLSEFGKLDGYESLEIEIAFAKIAPAKFGEFQIAKAQLEKEGLIKVSSAVFQGIGELANAPDTEEIKPIKARALFLTATYIAQQLGLNQPEDKILSDAITAYAAFKTQELAFLLRDNLKHKDAVVRATVAGLLAEQPASKENFDALGKAFDTAFLTDTETNDATLAILDALFKVNQADSLPIVFIALNSNDYLVRKKAFELMIKDDSAYSKSMVERAMLQKKDQILPFLNGSKLGQVLNTNADYKRAVSRKNGTVKAVFTTSKGNFTIDLNPEEAPLTVDNFIKLAKSNYFNGLTVHRVVPNFVMQDGDPRGDGNGGPGWQIRCEINTLTYQRGAIGMALSGKDTGGSQWFATHSPQPHLDGGYTVFGKINESDMKIVDEIVRGDKILSVKIIGDSQSSQKKIHKRK
jgi:cyclophilin family peptidyl-prolyl cis-trans isomerase